MSDVFKKFLKLEAASGIILIMAAVLAMILANSGLASGYQAFLDTPVQVRIAALDINKPLLLWINDGFMAIFFLLVGLEVKREMLEGALSSRVQATFPAIAAVGGMLAPALIYTFFNYSDEAARAGWAIPAATDIAFALGVMALLGKRVPVSLKVFLLALAIMDDLGVIIIIALFYTQQLSLEALAVGILATLTLLWMNRRGEDRIGLYMLVGLVLWVAVLKSGVHATLAGVVVGFMIPLNGKRYASPLNGKRYASPLKHLEHALHPWSAYLILPLFAFANAGVSLDGIGLSSLLSPVPMGIMLGLFVGKPLGVFTISWLSVKLGIAQLPSGVNFKQIFAVSILCGIGFTMSMFIASLAFEHGGLDYGSYSRLGILVGSTLAAVVGYLALRMSLPNREADQSTEGL
ncbi:pH-dependent sodium/proton antiporter [Aeromonas salmonicida subsp. salmonicida]|uniref:Na(+)/H(+) antiporter NhaA n=2 Tax=Aeromonas salmonicida TaxID=645 RepID=A0ABN0E1I2_AERSS|nr:Na+/H+ antiporter NhaA [Aeromonas salmonicida]AYO61981.1 Na+/H+ antiporter NhaA [Aeromonas salmonicida subsp. salmonicida 01-B526]EHI52930.1 pH-dependent sodium/proton antiporter [Aeromonas salmonicida subsp. salmonicida 01-B526]EKP0238497.1 Na+/H+ antiporter NhaA [Aeromonas salmonicida]EKP0242680.1 Na+/H+ antiporter NhaA [Aeromonas salmonicida]EKP0250956.1 Na+/H+ antiporter NhaA [Aeromonas salmonicida]